MNVTLLWYWKLYWLLNKYLGTINVKDLTVNLIFYTTNFVQKINATRKKSTVKAATSTDEMGWNKLHWKKFIFFF